MMSPAEPLVYSFLSTIGRFSGFFYQCYLIPLLLGVLVLSLGRKNASPGSIALRTLLTTLIGAALYFSTAPLFSGFVQLGTVSHLLLMGLIVLYSVFFSPLPIHERIVVTAAVIANINWAQSISTQILMPLVPINLSNLIQLILLLLSLVMVVVFRPSRAGHIPTAYWLSMLLIAGLSTACLYAIRILGGQHLMFYSYGTYFTLTIVLASFYVVNLLVYYLYHVLVKEHKAASDMSTMQAKLEQDLAFYKRSETLTQEYRSLRHELKNHFSVMESLLRDERYDQLRQYFEDYAGKTTPQLEEFCCPNALVSSVISHQMNTARAAGVHLDVIAAVPRELGIADDDLCSLLSNMLDNGVEACLRAGQNCVKATLHTDKNCLFVTVTNPVTEDVLKTNPDLRSTKQNPAAHGFGIPILRRIAEKYDGIVSFHTENGWFTADAMLYMED